MDHRSTSIADALDKALETIDLTTGDGTVATLADRYAHVIDNDPLMARQFGPPLLECLRELGLTPKARNAVMGGNASGSGADSALDKLRSRHDAG